MPPHGFFELPYKISGTLRFTTRHLDDVLSQQSRFLHWPVRSQCHKMARFYLFLAVPNRAFNSTNAGSTFKMAVVAELRVAYMIYQLIQTSCYSKIVFFAICRKSRETPKFSQVNCPEWKYPPHNFNIS